VNATCCISNIGEEKKVSRHLLYYYWSMEINSATEEYSYSTFGGCKLHILGPVRKN